jgi:hypothetical protein
VAAAEREYELYAMRFKGRGYAGTAMLCEFRPSVHRLSFILERAVSGRAGAKAATGAAGSEVTETAWIPLVSNAPPVLAAGKIRSCKHARVPADVKAAKSRRGGRVRVRFSVLGQPRRARVTRRVSREIFLAASPESLHKEGAKGYVYV